MTTLPRMVGSMGVSVFIIVAAHTYWIVEEVIFGRMGFLGPLAMFYLLCPIVLASVIPLWAWRNRQVSLLSLRHFSTFLLIPFAVVVPSFFVRWEVYFDMREFPFGLWVPLFVSFATFVPSFFVSLSCGIIFVGYLVYFGLCTVFMVFDKKDMIFDLWGSFAWIYSQFVVLAYFPESYCWLRKTTRMLFSKKT